MSDASLPLLSTPLRLTYRFTAGEAQERWLRALAAGRLVGVRCPRCANVYFPPLGLCALDGALLDEAVELTGKATVTAFTTVNVPFYGQELEIPYVLAHIQLDGTDEIFPYPLQEIDVADVRLGHRVEAVWRPEAEWDYTLGNIAYFRPIDEPATSIDDVRRYQ